MKNFLAKLYILGSMALTVIAMVFIWKMTFGHLYEANGFKAKALALASIKEQDQNAMAKSAFERAIFEEEERVKHYLGYRVLEEKKIEGHFQHIDFDFVPDKNSYCIKCHGDMPHSKIKELRAFGNMHSSFLSCQVCHVRIEPSDKIGVFKWYDRSTGEIVPSPVRQGAFQGAYQSKIVPFERVNGELQRIDSQDRTDFALEYSQRENTLTDIQKAKAKKIIHQVVSEKPYKCQDCHNQDKSVLPFRELGYQERRIATIISSEVVGMINNYTKFYMPRILHPGFGEEGNQPKGVGNR